MRRRVVAPAGVAGLVAALALVMTSPVADAATLAKAGWWWRLNDPTLPVPPPPPPTVPEGGLMVAGSPDGATAVAALSFELDEGEASPILTLTTVSETGGETAIMAACVTGSFWNAASAGRWNEKPSAACEEGSVTGVRAADGSAWSFALAPLVSEGLVDVVLVAGTLPDVPSGAPDGSTFEVVFEAPTAGSLATGAGTDEGGTAPIDAPDFAAPGGEAPSPPPIGDSFTPPAIGGDLSLPAPADGFTPALPESDQGLTATAPVAQQQNPPLAAEPLAERDTKDARSLAAVVLVVGGAAALWASQRSTSSPGRLGRFATPGAAPEGILSAPGGLGRFARPRTGPVPRL